MCSRLANFVQNGYTIYGAALNYKSLALDKKLPFPEYPLIFIKPTTSYITEGTSIKIPEGFVVNEEIELGVIIGKECKGVSEESAMQYVGGYCAGLDMTAVSELLRVKKNAEPWTMVKAFDTSCPVSRFITTEEIPDPHNVNLFCKINGKICQDGNTNDLIYNIPQLISYLSKHITLRPNDLILTGSPVGVRSVERGDVIECGIKNIVEMKFNVE